MGEIEQAGQENPNNGVWGYQHSSSWMVELGGGSSSHVPGTVVGILQPWSHGVCISAQQGGKLRLWQVTFPKSHTWLGRVEIRVWLLDLFCFHDNPLPTLAPTCCCVDIANCIPVQQNSLCLETKWYFVFASSQRIFLIYCVIHKEGVEMIRND